jgi:hypothetical protein
MEMHVVGWWHHHRFSRRKNSNSYNVDNGFPFSLLSTRLSVIDLRPTDLIADSQLCKT